ncbi:MAG: hypothetical protein IPH77_12880 [Ignavibacteria bacterium]|nr:hypothetical protein [Ignavibacteria bacterium]
MLAFRITRNADLELEEEEVEDLLTLIEEEVKKRRLGILETGSDRKCLISFCSFLGEHT